MLHIGGVTETVQVHEPGAIGEHQLVSRRRPCRRDPGGHGTATGFSVRVRAQGPVQHRGLRPHRREPVPSRRRRSALDVLDRRRHRVVRQRPPLPEPRHAAARGRGAHRGADQLLPLRLPGRRRTTRRSRSRPRSRRARGTANTGWRSSACRRAASTADARRRATSCSCSTSPARWTPPDKLPLVKTAHAAARRHAQPRATASRSSSTPARAASCCRRRPATDKAAILAAIARPRSRAARPTARAGIQLAYQHRRASTFVKGGINRVILATDGDFNVGVTSQGELIRLIEEKRDERHLPDGARLRHRQPQGLDDGEARRQGERQLRLHRLAARGAARCSSREAGAHARHDRQGREDPGRVQPADGRRVPADRLREPAAARTRTSTTTRRTPARSAPATP